MNHQIDGFLIRKRIVLGYNWDLQLRVGWASISPDPTRPKHQTICIQGELLFLWGREAQYEESIAREFDEFVRGEEKRFEIRVFIQQVTSTFFLKKKNKFLSHDFCSSEFSFRVSDPLFYVHIRALYPTRN